MLLLVRHAVCCCGQAPGPHERLVGAVQCCLVWWPINVQRSVKSMQRVVVKAWPHWMVQRVVAVRSPACCW